MEWYYAEDRQQRGPVGPEEFQRLVEQGVVGPDTLVWRQGMERWQPYRSVAGGTAGVPVVAPASVQRVCSVCEKSFALEDLTRHGEGWVCAGCKPVVLDSLASNVDPAAPAGAGGGQYRGGLFGAYAENGGGGVGGGLGVSEEELLAREYEVNVGDCLSRSWELFQANMGVMLGGTALVYLVVAAINVIPYLSVILSLVLTGPLMGGLWYFYILKVRGVDATAGVAFSGFGPQFGQLALANVVTGLLSGLCLLPAFGLFVGGAVLGGGMNMGEGEGGAFLGIFAAVSLVLLIVGFAGYVYLAVSWMFTLLLVADKGMAFWPAMELSRRVVAKRFWGVLWLSLVAAILGLVGMLLCFVGILFFGPLAMGMLAYQYQAMFGDLRVTREY